MLIAALNSETATLPLAEPPRAARRDDTKPLAMGRFGAGHRMVVALALAHLAVGVFLAATLNIWMDEAFTYHTTGHGVAHAWRGALDFELQPPLYFVALAAWRALDDSVFFARLPSVVAAAATVLCAAGLSRRFIPALHPAWAAAFFAAHPFVIWAGVEMRCYAAVLLLATLLLWTWDAGYLSPGARSRQARAAHVVLAVAAVYTQYYLGFLLAASGIGLIAARRWSGATEYLKGMALVAVCLVPLAWIVPAQVRSHTDHARSTASPLEGAQAMYWRAQDYLLPIAAESLAGEAATRVRDWTCRGLAIVMAVALWRTRATIRAACRRPEFAGLLGVAVALAALLALLRDVVGPYHLQPRHTAAWFAPLGLAVLMIAASVGRRWVPALLLLVLVAFSAPVLAARYGSLTKPGDWRAAAEYVAARESAGEPIAMFVNMGELPWEVYYRGVNRVVPLPAPLDRGRADFAASALVDEAQLAAALSKGGIHDGRFWLVVSHAESGASDGIEKHGEVLENFVARRCDVLSVQAFRGTTVRLCELLPAMPRSTSP